MFILLNQKTNISLVGQTGEGGLNAGHVNWFLGSTAGILGGRNGINGVLNNLKSLAAQYPPDNYRETKLTING